jgi:catechol 2,3-dioxygenase-like lactoylglutathione lyase family enzyme
MARCLSRTVDTAEIVAERTRLSAREFGDALNLLVYNGRLSRLRKMPKRGHMWLDRITRRDALLVLGAATLPHARAEEGLLRVTRVDHVGLMVGDIDKAMLFYRRLFGNEVLKDSRTPRRYLRLGPCYMAIAPAAAGEAKRVDHFAVGIEHFDAASMQRTLEKAGLKVRESNVGLFVVDPDGTSLQIWADQSWKQLSNAAPEAGPKQETLFHPLGMHHVAIQVSDMARSTAFYRKLFGEPAPGQGDPPQPTFQAGETRILLYNPAPNKPAKIDHFSVLVDNFDAASALKVVKSLGANAELSKQGTLNEFFDPDGIRLQVTFPGQTYGNTTKK